MKETHRLLAEARRDLADRNARGLALGRDWLIIETLFRELDRDRPFLLPADSDTKDFMPDPIIAPATYLRADDIITHLHRNFELQFQTDGDKMERPAAVEHFKNREALLRVRKILTDAAEHALNAKLKPSATDKQVIIFINDQDFGQGSLAHCIGTAIQWYGAFLENLDDGDEIEVTFKRQDMTKAELDALPEI